MNYFENLHQYTANFFSVSNAASNCFAETSSTDNCFDTAKKRQLTKIKTGNSVILGLCQP